MKAFRCLIVTLGLLCVIITVLLTALLPLPRKTVDFAEMAKMAETPTELIGGLKSGLSVEAAVKCLKDQGYSGENQSILVKLSYQGPEAKYDHVEVEHFRHIGFEGKLTLTFVENMLYRASLSCDANDEQDYLKAMKTQFDVDLINNRVADYSVRTRLYVYNTEIYIISFAVVWIDEFFGNELKWYTDHIHISETTRKF